MSVQKKAKSRRARASVAPAEIERYTYGIVEGDCPAVRDLASIVSDLAHLSMQVAERVERIEIHLGLSK